MLLIYHLDSETDQLREIGKEIRLQLGFFPKSTQRLTLKMVGYANDSFDVAGDSGCALIYLEFPDLRSRYLETDVLDATIQRNVPGIGFEAQYGQPASLVGKGDYYRAATTHVTDLDLGFMDPQKDYFSVKISSRFARDENEDYLNNASLVFELHDVTSAT